MNNESRRRCPWVDLSKPEYVSYHDLEWGVPLHEDQALFEYLVLESAQAGLSWYTVLRKRESYRQAFAQFDPYKVARFNAVKIESLLSNQGIIRNRLKVIAAVNNAQCFLKLQDKFGTFDAYIWDFVDGRPLVKELHTFSDYPTTTPESERLTLDLKKRGFKFMGPKIVYAFMQAIGMVNDHSLGCFRRPEIIKGYQH